MFSHCCFVFATLLSCLVAGITAKAVLPRSAAGPIVDLGYSQYEGTTLSSGVNQYLGMRFAAPPLGDLRFRAPAEPLKTASVQPAKAVTISTFLHGFRLDQCQLVPTSLSRYQCHDTFYK
jgi:hypothetical protein